MVDVEQHALRALEQYALAVAARIVELAPDGAREGKDKVCNLRQVAFQPCAIDWRLAEAPAKRVVVRAQAVQQGIQVIEPGKVAEANRATAAGGTIAIAAATAPCVAVPPLNSRSSRRAWRTNARSIATRQAGACHCSSASAARIARRFKA